MDLPFAENRFVIHVAVVFTKTTAYVLRNNNVFKFLSNFNFFEWMLPVHCRVVSGWGSRENLQKPGLLWKYLCTWKLNMYDKLATYMVDFSQKNPSNLLNFKNWALQKRRRFYRQCTVLLKSKVKQISIWYFTISFCPFPWKKTIMQQLHSAKDTYPMEQRFFALLSKCTENVAMTGF